MSEVRNKKVSGFTVEIHRDSCIGTGACRNIAPEVFEFDDQQIVDFVEEPQEIEGDRLRDACEICPVDALHLIGEDGGKIVP